jgi:hypothetical protein
MEEKNTKKLSFTVKKVLRVLSLLCFGLVFCPAFLVSCSGQDMPVSTMTAVVGVSEFGEEIVKPHPIMLISFVIPIVIFVLLLLKKMVDKKRATIVAVCTVVDLLIWILFAIVVKKYTTEGGFFSFETTGWYKLNFVLHLVMILFAVLVMIHKLQMDTDLLAIITGTETKNTLKQMSSTMGQMSKSVTQIASNVASNVATNVATNAGNLVKSKNTMGFCPRCGSPLEKGSRFCSSCGSQVPEFMTGEASVDNSEQKTNQ